MKEGFAEVQVPIFDGDRPELSSDLAVRESRYSGVGSVEAHKIGLDFQVYSDLRLRGHVSRDVREATFAERFDSQGSGGAVNDPAPVGLNGATEPVVPDHLGGGRQSEPGSGEGGHDHARRGVPSELRICSKACSSLPTTTA